MLETTVILANLALIATLLRARLASDLVWLTLIAGLGLGETPALVWASRHLAYWDYYRLHYGIALTTDLLYLALAWQLGPTKLHLVSFAAWVYLGLDAALWTALGFHWETARCALDWIQQAVNPVTLLFWAWQVFRYDQWERRVLTNGCRN